MGDSVNRSRLFGLFIRSAGNRRDRGFQMGSFFRPRARSRGIPDPSPQSQFPPVLDLLDGFFQFVLTYIPLVVTFLAGEKVFQPG